MDRRGCALERSTMETAGGGTSRLPRAFHFGELHRWRPRNMPLPAKNLYSWAPVYTGLFPALAMKACYHRFAIVFRPHLHRDTVLYNALNRLSRGFRGERFPPRGTTPPRFDPPLR